MEYSFSERLLPCNHLEKMYNIELEAADHQIKSANDNQLQDLYMRADVCDRLINLLQRMLSKVLAHRLGRILLAELPRQPN